MEKNSTVRKFRTVQIEGSREVELELDHNNLDVIMSVGYRVKSGDEFEKFQQRQKAVEKEASFKELEEDIKKLKKPESKE